MSLTLCSKSKYFYINLIKETRLLISVYMWKGKLIYIYRDTYPSIVHCCNVTKVSRALMVYTRMHQNLYKAILEQTSVWAITRVLKVTMKSIISPYIFVCFFFSSEKGNWISQAKHPVILKICLKSCKRMIYLWKR